MNTRDVCRIEDMKEDLYATLAALASAKDMESFLADLCTFKEVEQMAQRLCAARLLKDGMTYTQVIESTGISSATLSRVSRCVHYGEGYNKVIK